MFVARRPTVRAADVHDAIAVDRNDTIGDWRRRYRHDPPSTVPNHE
jgi:hypothetical protein